jgi:Mce-associated membrane protein
MTPSLYDLLNVDPSASTEEIRAAWKAAIADLDPTDRRFRAYNQAAETLLDPERRRTYDAELALEEPDEPESEIEAEPEPEAEPEVEPEPEPVAAAGPEDARTVPLRTLVVAGVLALAAIAGTVWMWQQPGASGDVDRYQARESAAHEAEDVAREAAGPVLSYDYRRLEDDVARATPYFTDDYADKYRGVIDDLAAQAKAGKLVVTAEPIATGIIRSGDDRAEILVFVDQDSRRGGTANDTLKMWVTMSLVSEGDGWLVDEMKVDTVLPS